MCQGLSQAPFSTRNRQDTAKSMLNKPSIIVQRRTAIVREEILVGNKVVNKTDQS